MPIRMDSGSGQMDDQSMYLRLLPKVGNRYLESSGAIAHS